MRFDSEIRIRPATDDDGPLFERLATPEEAGEYNTFEADPTFSTRQLDVQRYVVEYVDGVPIGDLSAFAVTYGPNSASTAWKIGITVLSSERGRGNGSRAQRMLAEHLFATTDTQRVEADTDVTNLSEQRALQRAGFTREGVLRRAQYRAGDWHDMVLYSLVRSDLGSPRDGESG